MIRLATSTTIKKFSVGLGAGCLVYKSTTTPSSALTTAEPSTSHRDVIIPTHNSLDFAITTLGNNASKVMPLVEASSRALRLVQTVTMIIVEYKTEEYTEKMNALLNEVGIKSNHPSSTRVLLEKEITIRAEELDKAQKIHTNNDISDGGYEVRKKAVLEAAERLGLAENALAEIDENEWENSVHARAAKMLRSLCRKNGGTYIKVGQHLANLDHLLPPAYIKILYSLFGDAPVTPIEDVREVIKEELGAYPEDIFEEFAIEPIASASLAQVHVAMKDGKKLAVKVQHRGLRETSKGDIIALETVIGIVDSMFNDFKWGWICEEIAPNLPRELDFVFEGKNAEAAAKHIERTGLDCVIPKVHWDQTSSRVLVMDFEEGHSVTKLEEIKKSGVKKSELATLISSVFQSQIFQSGFVHCDPHPENVYWRMSEKGKPQLVLFDHGLYKQLDDDFRMTYAQLWKSLLIADIEGIKESCSSLGVEEMYPLLAAMLTSRPFDEVIEREKTKAFTSKESLDVISDAAMIRGYAQQYLKEIIQMLDKVPRQMLLLFKMNDCLRHIDHSLGSPANTLIIAGKYATETLYVNSKNENGLLSRVREWISYVLLVARIKGYEMASKSWLIDYK
mmetsp:Transcript_29932/g.45809  ORF Transcript_29932/g.45809 Transcript_29932/m.45809 type:complete len:621 (+) Transcript_29932:100-1962(+)